MRLHLADIHLHRACLRQGFGRQTRLFFREKPYPWKSSQDDLAAACSLIKHPNSSTTAAPKDELEDAEHAAKN